MIPDLTYKSGEQMEQLGKYGFLRRDYLKNHRNSTYQVMLLQDTIGENLLEVDKAAREREEVILKQLEEKDPFIDFFMTPFMWYVRFCKWLVYPTYDNGFNQKIAYTGGEVWVIRILAIVAVLFVLVIAMVIIIEAIKRYKKMWDEISQMFLIGSLSGIAVLGDVIKEYLPMNLILLFGFINVGMMLFRIYLRKKFDYM